MYALLLPNEFVIRVTEDWEWFLALDLFDSLNIPPAKRNQILSTVPAQNQKQIQYRERGRPHKGLNLNGVEAINPLVAAMIKQILEPKPESPPEPKPRTVIIGPCRVYSADGTYLGTTTGDTIAIFEPEPEP